MRLNLKNRFMLFLKLFDESFRFAIHALRVNKLRTILSLLGVSIGIFSVIAVFTMVDAMEKSVKDGIASLGDNVIYIEKWPWSFEEGYPWWKYMNRPLPGFREMKALQDNTTSFEAFSIMAGTGGEVFKFRDKHVENATLIMASHDYYKIRSFEIQSGRYFSDQESASGNAYALIGSEIAKNLFDKSDPIGKQITVRGRKVYVIGVFKKEGESMIGNSLDECALIPINMARKVVDIRSDKLQPFIMARGKPGITNDELIAELRSAMRNIRRLRPVEEDNFALNETKLLANGISGIFDVLQMAGWIIGGFSILVGGFGIANILFVSVKERTNQIGIQKSLGAKNYFILLQFLFESIVLCLIGGLVGLGLVYIGTLLIPADYLPFEIKLSVSNIILALTISTNIGIISGFIPSYTASQLDPVEAIRS